MQIAENRSSVLIYVAQNDKVGQLAKPRIAVAMAKHPQVKLILMDCPAGFKDLGEMDRTAAQAAVNAVYPVWSGC